MNWLIVLVGVAIAGFICWELAETSRLNAKAERRRRRQDAAADRRNSVRP